MGTDGCGMYGTDSIDEQIALTNFLQITDDELLKMKEVEDFQGELNDCATERDFYLAKLLRIESICDEYSEKDADAVIQILSVSSNDFEPIPA